jgi:hypothetical protein
MNRQAPAQRLNRTVHSLNLTKLDAKGRVEVHVSSDEESEGEFVTERKEPVPRWEQVLGENKEQARLCMGAPLQATGAGGW